MKNSTIMQRGDHHYLVPLTDEDGVICHDGEKVRYPKVKIQSALARGYWEKAKDQSIGFRRRLLSFPEVNNQTIGDQQDAAG